MVTLEHIDAGSVQVRPAVPDPAASLLDLDEAAIEQRIRSTSASFF